MKDALKIYKGKNVLVTGHTGFKGSWLAIWLNELGAKVIGYALEPAYTDDNYSLSGIKDKIIDLRGDIRDEDGLKEVFSKYEPEIVFHLAAQPIVRYSYEHPRETYEINVMGTMNVLECIRNTPNTRAGVIVTSDKCYENKEWVWGYREEDEMGGYDPYSSSKGCVELLVSSYRNSFFNIDNYRMHKKLLCTTRAGNVIGGGDRAKDRIVPDCMAALSAGNNINVRNPEAVRPFQHVLEPLSGYLLLGAKLLGGNVSYSGAWNFGPEQYSSISVEEMVNKLIKYWGKGSWRDCSGKKTEPHEAKLLSLDISKARQYLRWNPRWNIDEAVEKTVHWYRNCSRNNIYALCVEQINEYIGENSKEGKI